MGWIIALGILALIAILPVGASVQYDCDGFRGAVIAGCFRIPFFPKVKKEKKKKHDKQPVKAKKTTPRTAKQTEQKEKKGGNLQDFLPVLDRVLDFLAILPRKLRIKQLDLLLTLGGGDPCDLAVNYGRGWAALGNLVPLLERAFIIKKRNMEVQCDFLSESTTIVARIDISITVGRIFALLIRWGFPVVWELFKVINKRKGGAKA